jgi:hypothetical protein
VRKRDLYRFVDQRIIEWELREVFDKRITRERIVEEARRLAVQEGTDVDLTDLTPDSVIVDQNMMHYGMKEKNPLDFVKFYSKHHPNSEQLFGKRVSHSYNKKFQPVPARRRANIRC